MPDTRSSASGLIYSGPGERLSVSLSNALRFSIGKLRMRISASHSAVRFKQPLGYRVLGCQTVPSDVINAGTKLAQLVRQGKPTLGKSLVEHGRAVYAVAH